MGARGTQTELWIGWPGGWRLGVSGSGADGGLSTCDVRDAGLDPDEIRAARPEWKPPPADCQ